MSVTAPMPRVSAVVVSFNTRADTLRCLRSLRAQLPLPAEIMVVDNASQDGSAEAIRADFPDVALLALAANVGFGAANNRALARVQTPYALLLNSDAELCPGAIEALAQHLDRHPEVGAAGPRTLNSDGTLQVSWGPRLTPVNEWRHRRWRRAVAAGKGWACARLAELGQRAHEPDWLSGSCLLLRMQSLRQSGFFDEGYFLYEEDADLCLRLRRARWTLAFVPTAEIVHHLGRSAAAAPEPSRLEYHRSHLRYYRLHNGRVRSVLLRAWLLGQAALGWLLAHGQSGDAGATRRAWLGVARLARWPALDRRTD